jgi:hypothetical protein
MTVRSLVRKSGREARIGASRTCSNCVSLADAKCQFWLFKLGQIATKTLLSVPGNRRHIDEGEGAGETPALLRSGPHTWALWNRTSTGWIDQQ